MPLPLADDQFYLAADTQGRIQAPVHRGQDASLQEFQVIVGREVPCNIERPQVSKYPTFLRGHDWPARLYVVEGEMILGDDLRPAMDRLRVVREEEDARLLLGACAGRVQEFIQQFALLDQETLAALETSPAYSELYGTGHHLLQPHMEGAAARVRSYIEQHCALMGLGSRVAAHGLDVALTLLQEDQLPAQHALAFTSGWAAALSILAPPEPAPATD